MKVTPNILSATLQDEMTYKNFPKEYKLIVARLAASLVPSSNFKTREEIYSYFSDHE